MMDFISNNAGMIGLLLFVSVFIVVIFTAFRPANKEAMEAHKNIPFAEEEDDLK